MLTLIALRYSKLLLIKCCFLNLLKILGIKNLGCINSFKFMFLSDPINLINSKFFNSIIIKIGWLLTKACIKIFFLQFSQLFFSIIFIRLQMPLNFIFELILVVMIKFKLVNKISGNNFRCISFQKEIKSNSIIIQLNNHLNLLRFFWQVINLPTTLATLWLFKRIITIQNGGLIFGLIIKLLLLKLSLNIVFFNLNPRI